MVRRKERRAPTGGASTAFDALITADQNLQYQQNLAVFPRGVFVLVARSTALTDLALLVPVLLKRLQIHEPRTLVRING